MDIVLSVVMDEQNKEMNMAATENETMTTTFGMIRTIEGDAQVGWCLFVNNSASPTGRTELDSGHAWSEYEATQRITQAARLINATVAQIIRA